MKRWTRTLGYVLALLMVVQASKVYAYRKVVANVPYIHQVNDMDNTKFLGYNACGPTSAVIMARFHNVQPIPDSSFNGWYVYNPYIGFTDKSGNNYSTRSAKDWNGSTYPHSVYGAHGYIVREDPNGDWMANSKLLGDYLKNHGLKVSNQIWANRFEAIKQNIDAGLPLIGHSIIYEKYRHYLVVVGYDTGANNNEKNVIVHDPYGNAADDDWLSGNNTLGANITYPLDGYCSGTKNHVKIDYVYSVHPIGIYFWFPGWRTAQQGRASQPFVDCYKKYGGINTFGIPWNNNDSSPWVHYWPDNICSENSIFLQDFIKDKHWWQLVLNLEMNEAFPIHGKILNYWHENYGYRDFGPPIETEHYATGINGNKLVIQKFKKNGTEKIICFDTVTGDLGECRPDQIALVGNPVTFHLAGREQIRLASWYLGNSNSNNTENPTLNPNPTNTGSSNLGNCGDQPCILPDQYIPQNVVAIPLSFDCIELNYTTLSGVNNISINLFDHSFNETSGKGLSSIDAGCVICGLPYPDTEYRINIKAHTQEGVSRPSEEVTCRTLKAGEGQCNPSKNYGGCLSINPSEWQERVVKFIDPGGIIGNSSFEISTLAGWKTYIYSSNKANFYVDNTVSSHKTRSLKVEIEEILDKSLKNIIIYQLIEPKYGTSYRLKFDAKGNGINHLLVTSGRQMNSFNFDEHQRDEFFSQKIYISSEFHTSESIIDVPKFNEKWLIFLAFCWGDKKGICYLDNVRLEEAGGITDSNSPSPSIPSGGKHIYPRDSIQTAIDAANNGDLIIVHQGTYRENINFKGKDITIKSEDPNNPEVIAATIIDASQTGSVATFENGEESDSVLSGVTLVNGRGRYMSGDYYGGGVYCLNSSPTIKKCIITGNLIGGYESKGGGIYCESSSPVIANCTINENSAVDSYSSGGGIYCVNSSPTILNCTISENSTADKGGGLFCEGSSPIITNCTISGNLASHHGAGICCRNSSSPRIENCTVVRNTAQHSGGGIYCYKSSPSISNCSISGNTAQSGGGIYCYYSSNPKISNCIINENSTDIGGGLFCDSSSPTITNCTISSNSAALSGGGIYSCNSSPNITNCILWHDMPTEIDLYERIFLKTVNYSDIQGGYQEGTGNLNTDPLFINPRSGDYHLQYSSPCIDMGTGNIDSAPNVDKDGYSRPMGIKYDMGAYEYCNPTPEVCDNMDNDCDGKIDEDLTQNCSTACGSGIETCHNGQWIDCTAPQPTVEACDGKDNDCDGQIDEGVMSIYYADSDGDGYGNAAISVLACSAPSGYVEDNTDCDDADKNIHPRAYEVPCNGKDDDCVEGDICDPQEQREGDSGVPDVNGVKGNCNGDLNTNGKVTPADALIAFKCYLKSHIPESKIFINKINYLFLKFCDYNISIISY